MSRRYLTQVMISNFTPDDPERVEEAILEAGYNLDFDWCRWTDSTTGAKRVSLFAQGENTLCGGFSEEDASREIRFAVWRVVQRFVDVQVGWIYIESPEHWHTGTENEAQAYLDELPRCERCGAILQPDEEDDGLCERCNLERPHADCSWCEKCLGWLDTDDPDDNICPACAIDAAEHKLGDR